MLTLIFFLFTILHFTVAREFKFIAGSACKPYTVGKMKSTEKKTACGDDGFAIMDSDAAKRVLFGIQVINSKLFRMELVAGIERKLIRGFLLMSIWRDL